MSELAPGPWKYVAQGPSFSEGPDWYYVWSGERGTDSERPVASVYGEANARAIIELPEMFVLVEGITGHLCEADIIGQDRLDKANEIMERIEARE